MMPRLVKLSSVRRSELKHEDGWSYIIEVYEDVTNIKYKDSPDSKEEDAGYLSAPWDIAICKEIIRLRELKEKEMEEED